jgi:uncharacterized membrane protein YkgB
MRVKENPMLFSRRWGIVGATLSFLTAFVTLSFLITTPDAWVSALGDAQHPLRAARPHDEPSERGAACPVPLCEVALMVIRRSPDSNLSLSTFEPVSVRDWEFRREKV